MRLTKGRTLRFGVDLRQNLRVTCSRRRNVRSIIKNGDVLLMQRGFKRERVFRDRSQLLAFLDDVDLRQRENEREREF